MTTNILLSYFNYFFSKKKAQFSFKHAKPVEITTYKKVIILHYGINPTLDYYFGDSYILTLPITHKIDLLINDTFPNLETDTLVVIVRYITQSAIDWLKSQEKSSKAIVLFIDDDLPANLLDDSLPLTYRHNIWSRFGIFIKDINDLCSELWVSNTALQQVYVKLQTRLIEPQPIAVNPNQNQTFYFYHGSPSTHREDIEWLATVVASVQAKCSHCCFMIMGNHHVKKLLSHLPRVIVLHPVSWDTYKTVLPALPHHIGLAPLMPTDFNKTRSHTKFFDFTRLNAVGIYSDRAPFSDFVRHEVDGLLLDNDPKLWAQKIIELASNHRLRYQLLENAKKRLNYL